jgi:CubicO group peptidase (beta-lactamase class C family)
MPDSPVATLRLEDILKGRTGLAYDIFNTSALAKSQDPVALALGLSRTPPTPTGWTYNDPVVGLLSPILARAEGRDLAAVAARDLFAPLGIERYAWRRDRQGKSLSYAGLALRTRDLAKIAWTMADGGAWRGKQVVPRDWVAQSTKTYGPAEWQLPPVANLGYGYLWFSGSMRGRQVVWGWGYGGQFALFAPELRLVVATAATSPSRENLRKQTDAVMALVAQLVGAAS